MNNWIFCIDSDGCVMDTMTYKHNLFSDQLLQRFLMFIIEKNSTGLE